jgi:hypothetical protein
LFYQNTFVGQGRYFGPAANVHFLNNLILGDGWAPAVFAVRTFTNYSSSDTNGFRPNPGAEYSFEWDSPPFEVPFDYTGKLATRRFKTLKEYSDATGKDKHSILVDFDVFENVTIPDKSDPQRLYNPEDLDFRLKAGSAAIDAGTEIPTITDGFTGKAPDLGAYELGKPLPHYGPSSQPPGVPEAGAPRSLTGPPEGK